MKRIALVLGLLLLVAFGALQLALRGYFGSEETRGDVATVAVSPEAVLDRAVRQARGVESLGRAPAKQILFGDFHVHTTFSFDAFLMNLPLAGGTGSHPPADACDFARYCSGVDFWSINDHAENLTPRLWTETVEMVRQCNAVAGDPANPDLVTFLGWEWSQIGSRPDNHYGHKNVVLLETDEGRIPTRPISSRSAAGPDADDGIGVPAPLVLFGGSRGRDFARFINEVVETPGCAADVPVRDLPSDCLEAAPTPEGLFAKLRDWDFPTLVIPHGTAWGMYTPAGSDWAKQLPGSDENLQTLLEVYSGHGNSERYFGWRAVEFDPEGNPVCPAPRDGYLPSCQRAGELIRERCANTGEAADVCDDRAAVARQHYVDAYQAGWKTVPGSKAEDWLDAGQCPDCFQPAFNYRPLGSAQYMLALRDFSDPADPKRFRFGFLGSSDNHSARPGTGYKEFARGDMSDGARPSASASGARGGGVFGGATDEAPIAESVAYVDEGGSPLQLFETQRAGNFFLTGGLVAVHSEGRDRQSIWDALERKEVYATSGPRILLWFDLVEETESGERLIPMGSTTERRAAPHFRAHALGSFEPQAGCPDHVVASIGQERIDQLCLGECHFPSDTRRGIERIEIIRILPQIEAGEEIGRLVEDPWQVFDCPGTAEGCIVDFEDPGFEESARDAVYYARAIETPSMAIHADPVPCTDGDCLAETHQRAWSSPIFVDWAAPIEDLGSGGFAGR